MNTLYFKLDSLTKMFGYVQATTEEVSGVGIVEKIDGLLVVTQVYLLEQECSSVTTEIDSDALGRLMLELVRQGKEANLKLWWHSHGSMDTFWSKTDDNTAKVISKANWSFRAVLNRDGKIKISADVNEPFSHTVHDLSFKIYNPGEKEIYEECKKEVKEKVKIKHLKEDFTQRFRRKRKKTKQKGMFEYGAFENDGLIYCSCCGNILLNNEKICPICEQPVKEVSYYETDVPGKNRKKRGKKKHLQAIASDKK